MTDLLVLGAGGFLGPHLVAAGVRHGLRVAAAARAGAALPCIPGQGAHSRHEWDALEPGALERLLDELRPRALISAVALARVEACERAPDAARALNAELPGHLACCCRERGVRLLHVSTDLVFGARAPRPGGPDGVGGFGEQDPPAAVHVYGRSKAEGEARVRATWPAALVVRLPLLYGDSLGRGLGASDSLWSALERGERPALFEDELRTPLEAGNAARALLELVLGVQGGLLHVAGPRRTSRLELGILCLRARGLTPSQARSRVRACTRAELGLAELRPPDTSLDASRARELLATPLLAPEEALGLGSA